MEEIVATRTLLDDRFNAKRELSDRLVLVWCNTSGCFFDPRTLYHYDASNVQAILLARRSSAQQPGKNTTPNKSSPISISVSTNKNHYTA